jgi:flagellar hook-associated protein 3 FlgL
MITNLSPQNSLFLANVNIIQDKISKANEQVSSGLAITVPSDSPDQIGQLLQLRANQSHNVQVQANLNLAQTAANAADDALSSAIQLMDSATTLATQGATSTTDAGGRQTLALQIQSITQEMVATSQATVQGSFIFSGDQAGTPQYTWDATAANPVVAIQSSPSTRQIENPAGGSFAASLTAQQIFDDQDPATGAPATDNVFNALSSLQTALQNNDTPGITNSIALLQAASQHLNTMQSFYGNVENQITNATTFANQYNTQLATEIGNIQDADIPTAAMQLTEANTQLQAAMQMEGQMPHTSLFNYLG